MPLIIIEGVDGAGKSVLTKQLREFLYGTYKHHGPYLDLGQHQLFEKYFSLMRAKGLGSWLIYDRSWLSEVVYGSIVRKAVRLSSAQLRMLERAALGCGLCWIYANPPHEEAFKNWSKGKEYVTDPTKFNQIRLRYASEFRKLSNKGHDVQMYDYTHTETLATVNDVFNWVGNTVNVNKGPGAGNFKEGNVLLLGDSVNIATGYHHWPFITSSATGCSSWLADSLDEAEINETDLYWVNVNDTYCWWPQVADGLPRWVQLLKPKAVVALGKEAKDIMNRYTWGCDTYSVYHPQYAKRFRSKEEYHLIDILTRGA